MQSRSPLTSRQVINFLGENGFIVMFVLWCVFLSFATDAFLTANNIFTVLRQATIVAIIAIGENLIVLLGGMDISLPGILTLSGVAMAALMVDFGAPPIPAALVAIALGVVVGFINALMVTRLRINVIIATLGMGGILEGLAFIYTQGRTVFGSQIDTIEFLSRGRVLSIIPVPVIILFVCYGLAIFVLHYTTFGARIYAVGSNQRAAWLSGIRVNRVKAFTFIIAGVTAAFGGIMQVARQGSATGGMGADFLFPMITAVVLGGTSMTGGRGKVLNTLIAAIFLTAITNGMVLLGVSIYLQRIISGAILIAALSLDQLRTTS
jgi:ribose/xylose/arabinose/galactoside ABC-type transport system permease subunit